MCFNILSATKAVCVACLLSLLSTACVKEHTEPFNPVPDDNTPIPEGYVRLTIPATLSDKASRTLRGFYDGSARDTEAFGASADTRVKVSHDADNDLRFHWGTRTNPVPVMAIFHIATRDTKTGEIFPYSIKDGNENFEPEFSQKTAQGLHTKEGLRVYDTQKTMTPTCKLYFTSEDYYTPPGIRMVYPGEKDFREGTYIDGVVQLAMSQQTMDNLEEALKKKNDVPQGYEKVLTMTLLTGQGTYDYDVSTKKYITNGAWFDFYEKKQNVVYRAENSTKDEKTFARYLIPIRSNGYRANLQENKAVVSDNSGYDVFLWQNHNQKYHDGTSLRQMSSGLKTVSFPDAIDVMNINYNIPLMSHPVVFTMEYLTKTDEHNYLLKLTDDNFLPSDRRGTGKNKIRFEMLGGFLEPVVTNSSGWFKQKFESLAIQSPTMRTRAAVDLTVGLNKSLDGKGVAFLSPLVHLALPMICRELTFKQVLEDHYYDKNSGSKLPVIISGIPKELFEKFAKREQSAKFDRYKKSPTFDSVEQTNKDKYFKAVKISQNTSDYPTAQNGFSDEFLYVLDRTIMTDTVNIYADDAELHIGGQGNNRRTRNNFWVWYICASDPENSHYTVNALEQIIGGVTKEQINQLKQGTMDEYNCLNHLFTAFPKELASEYGTVLQNRYDFLWKTRIYYRAYHDAYRNILGGLTTRTAYYQEAKISSDQLKNGKLYPVEIDLSHNHHQDPENKTMYTTAKIKSYNTQFDARNHIKQHWNR